MIACATGNGLLLVVGIRPMNSCNRSPPMRTLKFLGLIGLLAILVGSGAAVVF
jgi:hypothetical protein